MKRWWSLWLLLGIAQAVGCAEVVVSGDSRPAAHPVEPEVRDLAFFLHRLRTLDHLPELLRGIRLQIRWDGAGMIGNTIIQRDHPAWGSTAYWYAQPGDGRME